MSQRQAVASIVDMLKDDHEKVKGFFEEYKDADSRKRQEIAKTAIQQLEIHAELEERLIYPAIRKAIDEDELMSEAIEEHHLVHVLIAELKKLKQSDERFEAKFNVLGEVVKHHIEEEEGEMLPQAEESDIDWDDLTAQVMKRKTQLMSKASSPSKNGKGKTRQRSSR
jgi:hemerythrin superfamily protein